jgi:uncharacterized protein
MPATPAATVEAMARRLAKDRAVNRRQAQTLRKRLPLLVETLVQEFAARKVILFGGLLREMANPGSDIDLAVEGLAPDCYFAALTRCFEVAGCNVDLVLLEEARPELLRAVQQKGETLYDG